jgi:hypothetical protein
MRNNGVAKNLHIFNKVLKNSVQINIDKEKYSLDYSEKIWSKFPKSLHKFFADNLTYAITWHMPLINKKNTVYHFDHPVIEPLFFKLLIYSIPMNVLAFKNNSVVAILKSFYNASFSTEFKSLNHFYLKLQRRNILSQSALILFSFGKDSLLTLGLATEVGIKPIVMFIEEPKSKYENIQKTKLVKKFKNEFQYSVDFFKISIGHIRQNRGNYWGWDIILSQYILTLIPYAFYYRTKYILLGNEQSCNSYTLHRSGFFINPVYEQSAKAMQLLQDIPKFFQIRTHVGSFIEPIHEIFITYILHHRYPELSKYQTSCFLEDRAARTRRWCGNCEKCARMYIFLRALHISPASVGFPNVSMLSKKKKHLYALFTNTRETSAYGGSGLGKDEQMLAFFLAYKSGVTGDLMKEYKNRFHREATRRKKELIDTYFGIHPAITLPPRTGKAILSIIKDEQKSVLREIRKKIGRI